MGGHRTFFDDRYVCDEFARLSAMSTRRLSELVDQDSEFDSVTSTAARAVLLKRQGFMVVEVLGQSVTIAPMRMDE